MIDTIFSAALAFCVLVGGTLAVASAAFGEAQAPELMARQMRPVTVASAPAEGTALPAGGRLVAERGSN